MNSVAKHSVEPKTEIIDGLCGTARVQHYLFLILRLFLGTVFLFASYDKILHPKDFALTVYQYQLLPDSLINLTALMLPFLELLLGLCLIGGFLLPGATVISTGLLAVFISALLFNLARGLDVHCGCFSTQADDGPADIWTLARDLGFLAASVYLTAYIYLLDRREPRQHATSV
jgi:uncharacterized membrane protein YphA (DoxX/SURF4 family)